MKSLNAIWKTFSKKGFVIGLAVYGFLSLYGEAFLDGFVTGMAAL
ncbi:hypothetical protein [uncultured Algimonas sp.]|nr:hypothetical protein [uncultured Algimonas sp.]